MIAQVSAQLQQQLPTDGLVAMEVAQQQDGGGPAVCVLCAEAKHPQISAFRGLAKAVEVKVKNKMVKQNQISSVQFSSVQFSSNQNTQQVKMNAI